MDGEEKDWMITLPEKLRFLVIGIIIGLAVGVFIMILSAPADACEANRFDAAAERAVRAMSNPCLDSVAVWYVDTLGFRKDTVYFRFPFEHEVKDFWIVNIPILDTVIVGYFRFPKGVDKSKLQIGGK